MKPVTLTVKYSVPDWAQWVAQDADGSWWAYRQEPSEDERAWAPVAFGLGEAERFARGPRNEDGWKGTLRAV